MRVGISAYYAWLNKPINPEKLKLEVELKSKLLELFKLGRRTYGARRLSNKLKEQGFRISRYKARRMMKELGLQAKYPKRFRVTTDSNHNYPASPNLLNRQFDVRQPNKVWTTDISYCQTGQGWMYVAVVMDLYSRQIVGYAVDEHMKTALCTKALLMAYWHRKPARGLIHHSDRGVQYASHEYRKHLKQMGMRQSMSKKGDCWDNAPTERFFRSLKYEQLYDEKFMTKQAARRSVIDYLAFYNGIRLHSKLGCQSPIQFEKQFYLKAA